MVRNFTFKVVDNFSELLLCKIMVDFSLIKFH